MSTERPIIITGPGNYRDRRGKRVLITDEPLPGDAARHFDWVGYSEVEGSDIPEKVCFQSCGSFTSKSGLILAISRKEESANIYDVVGIWIDNLGAEARPRFLAEV